MAVASRDDATVIPNVAVLTIGPDREMEENL